jgi:hypothetical protein
MTRLVNALHHDHWKVSYDALIAIHKYLPHLEAAMATLAVESLLKKLRPDSRLDNDQNRRMRYAAAEALSPIVDEKHLDVVVGVLIEMLLDHGRPHLHMTAITAFGKTADRLRSDLKTRVIESVEEFIASGNFSETAGHAEDLLTRLRGKN